MEPEQRETRIVMVATTTATEDEALRIARACVEKGLAACVHIDRIRSVYSWDDALQEDTEYRLFLKTAETTCQALMGLIEEMHGYELPGIYCLPIIGGNEGYLAWIRERCPPPEKG